MLAAFGRPAVRAVNTDRAADITGTSSGAISAGTQYTGFTNPAATIFTSTSWTSPSTSKKYIRPTTAADAALTSDDSGRDVEVTTWTRIGTVFLRIQGGTAYYFKVNLDQGAGGRLVVGYCTNLTFGSLAYENNYTPYIIETLTDLVGETGMVKTATQDDTFTFGADGFDLYAKWNGVEFWRIRDFRGMLPGTIAIHPAATIGFRDTSVNWLTHKILHSHGYPYNNTINIRDFGAKSIRCKGTITGGTDQLTLLSSNPGFAVDDRIIVEIGGESHGGLRGVGEGVGGSWPALSYANSAAREADTSQVTGTFAWMEDDGNVWRWTSATLTWAQFTAANLLYMNKVLPKALKATVTAVSGNVLTLDTDASVTATSANVYHDSIDAINDLGVGTGQIASIPDGVKIHAPQGHFAISEMIEIQQRTAWNLFGDGQTLTRIFSPNGAPSCKLAVSGEDPDVGSYCLIRDLYLKGNLGQTDNYYGLSFDTQYLTETSYSAGYQYPHSYLFTTASNITMQDVTMEGGFQGVSSFCDNPWLRRVDVINTHEFIQYIQWLLNNADCVDGGFEEVSIDSDVTVSGIEFFASNGSQLLDSTFRNASMAVNTSGGAWLVDNCTFTFEGNNIAPGFAETTPIINVNSTIGQQQGGDFPDYMLEGGTISNVSIVQEDYVTGTETLRGITVNVYCPNITISDTTIEYPAGNEGFGIGVDASVETGLVLDNVKCIGSNTNINWGDITVGHATPTLTDIIAERYRVGTSPVFTAAPAITGTATTGNVQTCSTGTWASSPTFTYQWYTTNSASDRTDDAPIVGQTNNTYTPGVAGWYYCVVKATIGTGAGWRRSNIVEIT
jgi:hypothetical protein